MLICCRLWNQTSCSFLSSWPVQAVTACLSLTPPPPPTRKPEIHFIKSTLRQFKCKTQPVKAFDGRSCLSAGLGAQPRMQIWGGLSPVRERLLCDSESDGGVMIIQIRNNLRHQSPACRTLVPFLIFFLFPLPSGCKRTPLTNQTLWILKILYPNQNSVLGVLFCRLQVHNIPAALIHILCSVLSTMRAGGSESVMGTPQ